MWFGFRLDGVRVVCRFGVGLGLLPPRSTGLVHRYLCMFESFHDIDNIRSTSTNI